MVCDRCILVVKQLFEKLNLTPIHIQLGEVQLNQKPDTATLHKLSDELNTLGFELIDDKKSKLIEQIKITIIELVQQHEGNLKYNLSDILSRKLEHEYNYLSNLFSETEGSTIEKYFIAQKIEKVKELLVYDELSLSEIAYRLNYSSVAYLSNQFKKVTGLTPGHFKKIKEVKRKSLDKV